MNSITNKKVASLAPTWSRYVGWSLLFDNPGQSLRPNGRFETIDCRVETDPELALYRALSRAAAEFKADASEQLGLCLLPPSSYHVTAFDCASQGSVKDAKPSVKSSLAELIEGLPESWSAEHDLVVPSVQSGVCAIRTISFRYSHLINWSNQVIVAALQTVDEASKANFDLLVEDRAKLSDGYRTYYGFGAKPKYTPHVSLAYFANETGGEMAVQNAAEWDRVLRKWTKDCAVRFDSASAYAFTDMATYFREKKTL